MDQKPGPDGNLWVGVGMALLIVGPGWLYLAYYLWR